MDNLKQSPTLMHYFILNATNIPRPRWDTLTAGAAYWACMFADFVSHSPAWGVGAKFATFCGVCSYSYKILSWAIKTARWFKNKGK